MYVPYRLKNDWHSLNSYDLTQNLRDIKHFLLIKTKIFTLYGMKAQAT